MSSGRSGGAHRRRFAGLLALLPILGADQAELAVREGNVLFQSGQYKAALRQYEAAAERMPESSVIEFNRGNALFKNRRSIATWRRWRPTIRPSRAAPSTTSA